MAQDNDLLLRITVNREINHGTPTIRGLRYPVAMLLELLSAGMSIADIVADYPDLEHDDILAALAYAARAVEIKQIVPLSA